MAPNVHYDPSRTAACVFSGHLSNLEELLERYGAEGSDEELEGHHVPVGSDAGGRDPRQLATEVVLRMARRVEDPLVLLSELQVSAAGGGGRVVRHAKSCRRPLRRQLPGSEPAAPSPPPPPRRPR